MADANPSKVVDVPVIPVLEYVDGVDVTVYDVGAPPVDGAVQETVTAAPTPEDGKDVDAVAVYGLPVPTSVAVSPLTSPGAKKSFCCCDFLPALLLILHHPF